MHYDGDEGEWNLLLVLSSGLERLQYVFLQPDLAFDAKRRGPEPEGNQENFNLLLSRNLTRLKLYKTRWKELKARRLP